jgi:hypothetical protein
MFGNAGITQTSFLCKATRKARLFFSPLLLFDDESAAISLLRLFFFWWGVMGCSMFDVSSIAKKKLFDVTVAAIITWLLLLAPGRFFSYRLPCSGCETVQFFFSTNHHECRRIGALNRRYEKKKKKKMSVVN